MRGNAIDKGGTWAQGLIAAMGIAAIAIVAAGTGCRSTGATEAASGTTQAASEAPLETASDAARAVAPDVPAADRAAVVAGNNRFALDLYQALRTDTDNTLYSPYSISLALAMTYAGARGETARQMAETLHYDLPAEQLHPALNALDQTLRSEAEEEGAFRLHLVNAIWGQQGYAFLAPFLDTLAEHYGAGMRTLDFGAEAARETINAWAKEETEDRIEALLPAGAITPDTTLVLANAIYFKAAWLAPFMPEATADAPFYRLDGSAVTAPTMRHPIPLGYAQGERYQAVELLYDGERASMVIVLPDAGHFEAIAASLDAERVQAIVTGMDRATFELYMPKFSYGAGFALRETLSAMGMRAPFTDADFSGMDGTHSLSIDNVYHKAFIAVDEAGTEAAAATAVVMKRSLPPELRIDRPFIYLIRDTGTGCI
ncbi:MAG: serpin family protein, partial [Anaerolineae bacterium]|nr:serpin family protein [Anaerolineae bacterium]